jgi:hypothetical protein
MHLGHVGAAVARVFARRREGNMERVAGFLIGCLAVALAAYLLYRSRARSDVGLTPEELEKKRALEDMADRLSP